VATKIDFHEFVEDHGLSEEESRERAKEATQGVIEAIRWLENVEGVLMVMDSSVDPLTQVNVTILGNLQARNLPTIIVANKIDLEESSPASLKASFPEHPVVPVSALTGYNMENLYKTMVKYFT
jgi:GTPase Era involved in 16S rRNA processing